MSRFREVERLTREQNDEVALARSEADSARAAALEEAAGIAAGFMRPTEGRIIAAAIRAAAKEEER